MMYADGFHYCDLGLSDTNKELYNCEESDFLRLLREELTLAEEAGIVFSQIHGPWRYPPQDATPEDRAERKEKMEKCFRAAKLLKCKYVVIHPIIPFGTKEDPDPEGMFQMNVEFFRSLLPAARENDVIICIENMPMSKLSISPPAETLRLIEAIDDPNVAFCLDTGHSIVRDTQPGEAVRMGAKYLRVLHVHDSDGQRDRRWYPGTGAVDWDDFTAALKEVGYAGVMSLETRPDAELTEEQHRLEDQKLAVIARKLADQAE
jgi:sugar phosphate isomerase/epimerase